MMPSASPVKRGRDAPTFTKVGCCGFGMSQKDYPAHFPVVEVQHTFYQPPQLKTLLRWRENAPPDFEFAIKAWQLITHTGKSPTMRRLRHPLTPLQAQNCGSFRPTEIVQEALAVTLECAAALQATRILFQCPGSFKPDAENVANLQRFFSAPRPDHLEYYWEPRGDDWPPELIASLCRELNLYHAVDPLVHKSVTPEKLYYRLHGKGSWRYVYSEEEIQEVIALTPPTVPALVLFNNVKMVENAREMQNLLGSRIKTG